MTLAKYRAKRNLKATPEPSGKSKKREKKASLKFVVQKHAARSLHYDFRLELDGVLKSWAIPKGPSLNPEEKRLAVQVEDHPIEYGTFEGEIPKGNYGAGQVIVWDNGTYETPGVEPGDQEKTLRKQLEKGELKIILYGKKLKGQFNLIRLPKDPKNWLLIKKRDEYQSLEDILSENRSVLSRKVIENPLQTTKKSPMPHAIKPMLAQLIDKPFNKKDWLFEIKWDGYRAIAEVDNGKVLLYSRNGKSFNEKFSTIVNSLKRLKGKMILDGEVVAFDADGNIQFQLLQNYNEKELILKYCVFDLLYYQDRDLRELPLLERKKILSQIIAKLDPSPIYYSDYVEELGVQFFQQAKKNHLEGIIGKKADSKYVSKRSDAWVKIKTHLEQEVVICGFTQSRAAGRKFAALILGIYKRKKLVYAGHVGTGFNEVSQQEIYARLKPLITKESPFKPTPKTNTAVTWVKPLLVAQVSFQEWTSENIMRQPVFHGLREDKEAPEVHKEEAKNEQDMKDRKRQDKKDIYEE